MVMGIRAALYAVRLMSLPTIDVRLGRDAMNPSVMLSAYIYGMKGHGYRFKAGGNWGCR